MDESGKINFGDITQIPENEFKEHFRDWMEQDNVARCLQAKLRKDLILKFNKTSLGKNLVAQTTTSHRLNLSPLVLALNTLVAEYLYAKNCHFTLSVFCTEVPYRNTLPDFEGARHFRFTEPELTEICDALCSNWWRNSKDEICKQYTADQSSSLLFVVLKYLLYRPNANSPAMPYPPDTEIQNEKKQEKIMSPDNHQFRYMKKLLVVVLKKFKVMSANMAVLQAQKVGPKSDHKSMNLRKLDSVHRTIQKVSENLRQMSLTKRKTRSVSTIVSAINSMTKQFERYAVGFHRAGKQKIRDNKESKSKPVEKSYSDWVKEMRSTPNGQKFLQKVEQSLHKALLREREKLEEEFQKRLQIQKNILKAKYKQKLSEELAKITAREKANSTQQLTNTLEKRLKEFELKAKKIHEEVSGAKSQADLLRAARSPSCNKETQTILSNKSKHLPSTEDKTKGQSKDQETPHVDNIVLDAKQRVQQLEDESNQLDRNIREFLEEQKSEKRIVNESASSILKRYARERSVLEQKCAAFRLPANSNTRMSSIMDEIIPLHSNTNPRALKESYANAVRLIDEDTVDGSAPPSPPCRAATKVTLVTLPMPRLKKNAMTLGATEYGQSIGNTLSPVKVHNVGQVFEMIDNGIPSESNGQRMNSNHGEESESSVKQINNDNGDGDAKKLSGDDKKEAELNTTLTTREPVMRSENEVSAVRREGTPRANRSVESPFELETRTSSGSFRYFDIITGELKAPKDSSK